LPETEWLMRANSNGLTSRPSCNVYDVMNESASKTSHDDMSAIVKEKMSRSFI